MKVTNPDIIRSGETELIDAITADMDWGEIGKIFGEKHNLDIDDDVEYKNGDIIVHDNQIAYQLNFDVKVSLSIVLDREGNYLSLLTSLDRNNDQKEGRGISVETDQRVNEDDAALSEDDPDGFGTNREETQEVILDRAGSDA